jgi:glyoxylase-like metal-dependent hydrolase (beta-lactamase superfamily II)
VLYLPKERVLITGDAVSYPIPYVSSKPRDQASGLRMLIGLDTSVIIPGHGPAFHDKTFVQLELTLIETVDRDVAEARRNGVRTLDALQKTVTADALRDAFAHGDSDLEARFRSRVSDLVGFALAEQEATASRSAP